MNYWWVNQSRGWKYEHAEGIVCSCTDTPRAKYREMVSKADVGDLIVHYIKQKGIMAVSQVTGEPAPCRKKEGLWVTPYGEGYGQGWMLRTEYSDLTPPHPRRGHKGRSAETETQRQPGTAMARRTDSNSTGILHPVQPRWTGDYLPHSSGSRMARLAD